jgi:murein endopeptidase
MPSMLSIGVIAMPQGSAASGHAASQIGMGLLRQLLAQEAKP